MQNELKHLFDKELDRKEFLKYMGSVFLTLIGVTNLIRALTHHEIHPLHPSSERDYGLGAYGGVNRK